MPLSPALLGQLAARGIIPPQSFDQTLAGAGLAPPSAAPPQAPPPTAPAAVPPAAYAGPVGANAVASGDANNAAFQRVLAGMTPEEKARAMAQSSAGVQSAMNGIAAGAPHTVQSTAAPGASGAVFATPPSAAASGGAFGAPTVVPAHSTSLVSPTSRAMFEKAQEDKLAAADAGAGAEVAGSEANAQSMQGIADTLEGQRANMREHEETRRKAYDAQQADYDKIRREASEGKLSPQDVGLMGHIGIALGSFGAALSGTKNFALEAINARIDRKLEADRANLQNKQASANGAREGLGEMRARFGDERTADAAERARELEKAKALGDVMVARAQSPMLAAKWQGIRAGIEGEQAAQHAQLEQWHPAALAQGGAGAASDVKPEEVMQLQDGRYVTVPEKDREKVVAAQNKAQTVSKAASDLRGLLKVPVTQRGLSWMRDFDASKKTMAAAEIESGGKGGKGIFEAFGNAIAARHMIFAPGSEASIARVEKAAQDQAHAAIENSAQYEVSPQLRTNAKGVTERKYTIKSEYQRQKQAPDASQFIKPAGAP